MLRYFGLRVQPSAAASFMVTVAVTCSCVSHKVAVAVTSNVSPAPLLVQVMGPASRPERFARLIAYRAEVFGRPLMMLTSWNITIGDSPSCCEYIRATMQLSGLAWKWAGTMPLRLKAWATRQR